MKVGDLVESRHHVIRGIVVETGPRCDDADQDEQAVRVKWFDGDESFEWVRFLRLISEGR